MRYWPLMLSIIGCISAVVLCTLFVSGADEYRAFGGSLMIAGALLFLADSGTKPDMTKVLINWMISMGLVIYALTQMAPQSIGYFNLVVPLGALIMFLIALACRRVFLQVESKRPLSR